MIKQFRGVLAAIALAVLTAGCLPYDDAAPRPEPPAADLAERDRGTPESTGTAAPPATTAAPTPASPPTASPPGAPTGHRRSAAARSAATKAVTALPRRSGTGRRVVYSVSRQRVWTVRAGGAVDRTYLVSGRPSQPDPGTFRVYSRSRHTSSSVSDETMEYMVRFTFGERTGSAIGFHSIPVDHSGRAAQSVHQLGKALSAGCIRQRRSDAAYLWRFAPVGTKVVVVS